MSAIPPNWHDGPAISRRPLKTRQRGWARSLAGWLTRRRIPPNAISVSSVLAAAAAAVCLLALRGRSPLAQVVLLVLAAGFIQLRLLANMLDGLVAVEGGLKSATGDLFNEVPDRLADILILVATGYAVRWPGLGPALGWLSAILAVLTAYIRLLGGALGLPQDFRGPMAKPHRMATLTLACLLSVLEVAGPGFDGRALVAALGLIAAGAAVTSVRRLRSIARALAAR